MDEWMDGSWRMGVASDLNRQPCLEMHKKDCPWMDGEGGKKLF